MSREMWREFILGQLDIDFRLINEMKGYLKAGTGHCALFLFTPLCYLVREQSVIFSSVYVDGIGIVIVVAPN